MLDAIEAVDWSAVPGGPQPESAADGGERVPFSGDSYWGPYDYWAWYDPECVATGLRDLACATSNLAAAKAASRLRSHGILHDHSGMVFPAAVIAAPILLDIIERGHPKTKSACMELLEESLYFAPLDDYTRVDTPSADSVPLCCAIAERIQGRRDALIAQGYEGRTLLAEASKHWRFEIQDLVIEHDDLAVFGILHGTFPGGRHPAELHDAHRTMKLNQVALEIPPEDDSNEACIRLIRVPADHVRARAILYPAICGENEH